MELDEEEIQNLEGGSSLRDCSMHDGIGPFNEVNLPGVWFYKMPHKVSIACRNVRLVYFYLIVSVPYVVVLALGKIMLLFARNSYFGF